jgi:aldose 1-epimerase
VIAPSGAQIEIAFGDQRAVVVEIGGGLRTHSVAGRDVLDGYRADEICTSGRGQVLIPWPNRIEDGSYELDGRRHQLPLTEPERLNAIHGLVRWARWTVGGTRAAWCCARARAPSTARYPFSLALSVAYLLSEEDFRLARPIGTAKLDHGFTDLERDEDGVARVELTNSDGDVRVTLWVDESYRYLMLFTGDPLPDVNRRSLAVEPMTCAPNAFRTGDGLIRLEPGASITSTWGIASGL